MVNTAPRRSLEQRREALQIANRVRAYRARLKVDLKAGRVQLAAVLLDPDPLLETAKVYDVLVSAPKVGRVKANKVLMQARISPSKTVGGLSPRQRTELVALVARVAPAAVERAGLRLRDMAA